MRDLGSELIFGKTAAGGDFEFNEWQIYVGYGSSELYMWGYIDKLNPVDIWRT